MSLSAAVAVEVLDDEVAVAEPDWAYLGLHGFDDGQDRLCFPLGADWHIYRKCLNPHCDRPAAHTPWLCPRCREAFGDSGETDAAAWCATAAKPPQRRRYREQTCAVGCQRPADAAGLCRSCSGDRRRRGLTKEEYLASGFQPRPGFGVCAARACDRLAEFEKTRLCSAHQVQWVAQGRPDVASWAETTTSVYTTIDEVPLWGLRPRCRLQVLRAYELQLRVGGRLSPSQVKSAVVWLRVHDTGDLMAAEVPVAGDTTAYLRVWRDLLSRDGASPESELARRVIRVDALGPRYKRGSGTIYLGDVHADWLVELTQLEIKALTAMGVSSTLLTQAGQAVRWFDLFLRQQVLNSATDPASIGRGGVVDFLAWLDERARDTDAYLQLAGDDPCRDLIGERLLPSLSPANNTRRGGDGIRRLLVTPHTHCLIVRRLNDLFARHREWLVNHGAGDLYLTEEEVPEWPLAAHARSEEEGRSQDALPEEVFLQLMRPENLELLGEGSRRNAVELTARLGRRPWEIRHLRFDCVEWHNVTIDRTDGTRQRRRYPFLVYWMQKVRKRHVLPLHETDVAVIERQQAWLRAERPEFFGPDGQPRSQTLLLFPTVRRMRRNTEGTHPYDNSILQSWLKAWVEKLPPIVEDTGEVFDTRRRVFAYAFRHTYAQLRADAGVALDVLQELMGHDNSDTTQVYYRVSTSRRAGAVAEIAAKYRFDIGGDRIRSQTPVEADAARLRAGVSSVPVPAGACHEMNNVRADGNGCPIFYRCFSCTFFTTDFTHLGELRQLRAGKAEQLARLEAGYGNLFRSGPLADANLALLRQEIRQLDELIAKCEADITSLDDHERTRVEQWLASKQRFDVVIPVEAVRARRRQLDQPTVDPITRTPPPATTGRSQ